MLYSQLTFKLLSFPILCSTYKHMSYSPTDICFQLVGPHNSQSAQKQELCSWIKYKNIITASLKKWILSFAVASFISFWLLERWLFANCTQTAHKEKHHYVCKQSLSPLYVIFYRQFHIELKLGRGDCKNHTGKLTSSLRHVMKKVLVVLITTNETFLNQDTLFVPE